MNKKTSEFNREFAKQKNLTFKRDNFKCLVLGSHFGKLTVDHIRKRSLGGDNDLKNLITLCVGCHSVYEVMPNKVKEKLLYHILDKRYNYEY